MEGKALLFKHFGGVDAVPICLSCTGIDEIVETVVRLAPAFGGINLEDISAPRCFEIEQRLDDMLDIPVFHDDQHGTAVVVLAALRNAARLTGRDLGQLRAVVSGAGAAGVAVTTILREAGIGEIAVADSKGLLHDARADLNDAKRALADVTNREQRTGPLVDALRGADVFIGVSAAPSRRLRSPRWRRRPSSSRWRTRHPRCTRPSRLGTPASSPRAQRLPEPDQQRAGLPRHLPRRARRTRATDQLRHEAARRPRRSLPWSPTSCVTTSSSRARSTPGSDPRSPRRWPRPPGSRASPGSEPTPRATLRRRLAERRVGSRTC
jgi:hypothetical protein